MSSGQWRSERRNPLRFLETALMSLLLLGIILLGAAQIVLRNFFSYSIIWADELMRMAVLWLAILGAMVASSESRHLSIGLVQRYFPESWHKPAAVVSSLFAGLVSGVLAWHSWRYVWDTRRYGDTILGDLPAWMFQVILPIGFSVICYRFLLHCIALLRGDK